MTEKTIKCGTRQEILDYLQSIVKGRDFFKNGSPETSSENDLWEPRSNTFEKQIDQAIDSGSPLVAVVMDQVHTDNTHFPRSSSRDRIRQFIVTDYTSIRLEREMARLDDQTLRQDKMEKIKWILQMDLDAEERWERILKVVEEFEGVSIPLTAEQ
jgi:hypothetical protein